MGSAVLAAEMSAARRGGDVGVDDGVRVLRGVQVRLDVAVGVAVRGAVSVAVSVGGEVGVADR